ncbi:helix-turn-helix transcriptional regulator [Salmonella enterica]|nr:helix-turn-helix transcriptional regulator [Salmonella enterica]
MKELLGKKLKVVRNYEALKQTEFAYLTGIALVTIRQYESGARVVGPETLLKVTTHPRFKKYTLWLMTGDLTAAAEQIAPLPLSENKDDNQ